MVNEEEQYINGLVVRANESVHFFSSDMKPERERIACADFLRALGIAFSPKDLVSDDQEDSPTDVKFGDALFQVREALDQGRKRHDEIRAHRDCLKSAKSIEDTLPIREDTFDEKKPLSYTEVYAVVTEALIEKYERYGQKVCSDLDALVYVNLLDRFLTPNFSRPAYAALLAQGWRSVSFFLFPYSHVIYATEVAPEFLRCFSGQTRRECDDSDKFFKL
jgi:hypothetical protein